MQDLRSVESSELTYSGHTWSVLLTRSRDGSHLGAFLKWRPANGGVAGGVTVKVKYSLTLVHRTDPALSHVFVTSQRFTAAQPVLGRSRLVELDALLDPGRVKVIGGPGRISWQVG